MLLFKILNLIIKTNDHQQYTRLLFKEISQLKGGFYPSISISISITIKPKVIEILFLNYNSGSKIKKLMLRGSYKILINL